MHELIDLFDLHRNKLELGRLSLHPRRWICSKGLWFYFVVSGKDGLTLDGSKVVVIRLGDKEICEAYELRDIKQREVPRLNEGYYFGNHNWSYKYENLVPSGGMVEAALIDAISYSDPSVKLEIQTPVGRIDCLSDKEIIEVKRFKYWKNGLGQVLAYSTYYKKHKPVLHLFYDVYKDKQLNEIVNVLSGLNVALRIQRITETSFERPEDIW